MNLYFLSLLQPDKKREKINVHVDHPPYHFLFYKRRLRVKLYYNLKVINLVVGNHEKSFWFGTQEMRTYASSSFEENFEEPTFINNPEDEQFRGRSLLLRIDIGMEPHLYTFFEDKIKLFHEEAEGRRRR
jgi:hypothetical protein